jgi:hypothetical protein
MGAFAKFFVGIGIVVGVTGVRGEGGPGGEMGPSQAYINSYNQAQAWQYYSQMQQYQQQEFNREMQGQVGVDIPPPLPVIPPTYLFTNPGFGVPGEGGE